MSELFFEVNTELTANIYFFKVNNGNFNSVPELVKTGTISGTELNFLTVSIVK